MQYTDERGIASTCLQGLQALPATKGQYSSATGQEVRIELEAEGTTIPANSDLQLQAALSAATART